MFLSLLRIKTDRIRPAKMQNSQKYDENTLDRSVDPHTTRWFVYSEVSFMRVRPKFRAVRDALDLSVTSSFWTF